MFILLLLSWNKKSVGLGLSLRCVDCRNLKEECRVGLIIEMC